YELWDELIALSQTSYLETTDIQDEQVKRSRALGTAYLVKGDLEKGRIEIASLSETLSKEKAEQQAAGEAAEAKAREEKKPDDQVAKAKTDAVQGHAGRVASVERALAELHGHWALAGGDHATALSHFEKAGLGKEALSRVYLKSGEVAKAEQLAREAVDQGKNKVCPLANLVEVLDGCGKGGEAADTFRTLQAISAHIDMQAPIFERLTAVAPRLGLPADWRLPETLGADIGQRPELDSLGPLRWQPAPAPDWTLSDPAGESVSLAQYHGKPVVLIFYLGFGCVHCVEQLNAFSPMTAEFAEAGIDILAISSDKPDVLSDALAARQQSAGPALSIPIVSDAELSVFKAYRAYDDFENMPLHATFLIDAEGLVRWHDISYEPFTDTRFLLGESKRLLSTPTGGHGRP
ncbi:MAG: peroxiredoxin family protein, partial [Pirellulales bacterium]